MYPAPAYPPQPYWGPPPGSPYQPPQPFQPALPYAPGQYEGVLHGELTADGQRIVLIAEGTDWGIRQICQRLDKLTPLLESPEDEHGVKIKTAKLCPATWPAVVQLGFSFNTLTGYAWVPGPRLAEWTVAEATRRLVPPPPLPDDLYPPWLKPYGFQTGNAQAIAAAGKYLLLDSPGLGKTVSALLGIEARRLGSTGIFPMVILVPSWEVGQSWKEHIAEWVPGWGTPRMHGGPDRVKAITARNRHEYAGDVFITTLATARRDAPPGGKGPLSQLRAATVVVDECHLIKNSSAQQTLSVQRIARHAATIVAASGTFITRNAKDAYAALAAMDPRSWPSGERYTERYCRTSGYDYENEVIDGLNPLAEPELRAVLAGQMHRYAKADVLDFLPPKIYSVRRPEIPAEWRKAYDDMEQLWLAELPDGEAELSAMDSLTRLTRLSQLASSAADVRTEYVWDERAGDMVPKQIVTLRAPSWKAESLTGILAERPDQPTAVFTESRQLAMIAGQYCEDAGLRTGYIVGIGDGNTYRITSKTRQAARDGFQAGKLDVIVCTAAAGGTGITLTAANCVVALQRSWELNLALQIEDRAHRLGSEIHDHVEIIDVVAQGTVDERRREVLRENAGQAAEFLQDPRLLKELLGGIR